MQGRHVPDIADILLRDEDTIRSWLKAYQTDRLSSIFPDYAGNTNASKLTPEQVAQIKQTLSRPETGACMGQYTPPSLERTADGAWVWQGM
jgi:transposase